MVWYLTLIFLTDKVAMQEVENPEVAGEGISKEHAL